MTGTFQLTGRILDKSKAPVARARLVLASKTLVMRDPVTNEVYAPPPRVTTNDAGYLCVDLDGQRTPVNPPGVELVVGAQYELRGVNQQLIGSLIFTAPSAGATLDISDIVPEPPVDDPTWSDELAALIARFDAISGMTLVEDPPGSGLYEATVGGTDRLVRGDDGMYVLDAADPVDATDRFVTYDLGTGHLPADVEDRIVEIAGGEVPVVPDASTTVKGIVELATNTETVTGTDAVRATTPAGVKAALDARPSSGYPMTRIAPVTTAVTPTVGTITRYDTTGGVLNPTLPALSGLTLGDRVGVQKAYVTGNALVLSAAGTDRFELNAASSVTISVAGDLFILEAASISGNLRWRLVDGGAPTRHLESKFASLVPEWVTSRSYVVGELVTSSGVLYQVTTAHLSGGSFDATKFAAVSGGGGGGVPSGMVDLKAAPYNADPAEGNDVGAIIKAAAQANPGKSLWLGEGRFRLSTSCALAGGDTLNLHGAGKGKTVLVQSANVVGFQVSGAAGTTFALAADIAAGARSFTLTDIGDMAVGDVLNIRSLKVWPGSEATTGSGKEGRYGELARVYSIAGNVVTLAGPIQWAYALTDTVTIERQNMTRHGINISGFTVENNAPNTRGSAFCNAIRLTGMTATDIEFVKTDGPCFSATLVWGAHFSRIDFWNLSEQFTSSRYAYGVDMRDACRDFTMDDCHADGIRHIFTCDSYGVSPTACYGIPSHAVISNCTATGSYESPFDTHQEGSDIQFIQCQSHGNRGFAFQARGKNTGIVDCTVSDANLGVMLRPEAAGSYVRGLRVSNLRDNTSAGFCAAVQTDVNPPSFVIENVYVDDCDGPAVFVNTGAAPQLIRNINGEDVCKVRGAGVVQFGGTSASHVINGAHTKNSPTAAAVYGPETVTDVRLDNIYRDGTSVRAILGGMKLRHRVTSISAQDSAPADLSRLRTVASFSLDTSTGVLYPVLAAVPASAADLASAAAWSHLWTPESLALADGASVTSWTETEASETSKPLNQNGANPVPTYVAASAGLNGRAALSFSAAMLKTASFVAPTKTVPNDVFVVVRIDPAVVTSGAQIFDGIATGNRHGLATSSSGGSNPQTWRMTANGGTVKDAGRNSVEASRTYVIVLRVIAGASVLRINGAEVYIGDIGSQTLTGLALGGAYNAASLFTGTVGAFGVKFGGFTATELADVERTAMSYYGVA